MYFKYYLITNVQVIIFTKKNSSKNYWKLTLKKLIKISIKCLNKLKKQVDKHLKEYLKTSVSNYNKLKRE